MRLRTGDRSGMFDGPGLSSNLKSGVTGTPSRSHACKLRDKTESVEIFTCSRCGKCYVCKHKAVHFTDDDKWVWKCPDGKFRPVTFEKGATDHGIS